MSNVKHALCRCGAEADVVDVPKQGLSGWGLFFCIKCPNCNNSQLYWVVDKQEAVYLWNKSNNE